MQDKAIASRSPPVFAHFFFLPEFEAKMEKIVYSDAELARFKELAGKPIWDKWIADNADKFDSQGVFDRMMELLAEAQAKYQN